MNDKLESIAIELGYADVEQLEFNLDSYAETTTLYREQIELPH